MLASSGSASPPFFEPLCALPHCHTTNAICDYDLSQFDRTTRSEVKKAKECLGIGSVELKVVAWLEREISKGEEQCRRFFLPSDELRDQVESIEVESRRMADDLPEVQSANRHPLLPLTRARDV